MPPEQRRLIVAKMVEDGMSTSTIASRIGVPLATVRTDRLILSVPNPKEVRKSSPEKPAPKTTVRRPSAKELEERRFLVTAMHRKGKSDKEIASSLNVSVMTVRRDRERLRLINETVEEIVRSRRQEVRRMIDSGASLKDIKEELGVSTMTVVRDRRALGYGPWNEAHEQGINERRQKVKALIESGQTYRKAAEQLGVSMMTVSRDCDAMGITSEKSKTSRTKSIERRRAAVRKAHEAKMSVREIASMLGVHKMTVHRDLEAQQEPEHR